MLQHKLKKALRLHYLPTRGARGRRQHGGKPNPCYAVLEHRAMQSIVLGEPSKDSEGVRDGPIGPAEPMEPSVPSVTAAADGSSIERATDTLVGLGRQVSMRREEPFSQLLSGVDTALSAAPQESSSVLESEVPSTTEFLSNSPLKWILQELEDGESASQAASDSQAFYPAESSIGKFQSSPSDIVLHSYWTIQGL